MGGRSGGHGDMHGGQMMGHMDMMLDHPNSIMDQISKMMQQMYELLATNRIADFIVFAERGYLNPGDPVGVHYNSQFSGASSASWHGRNPPVYPVTSFVSASSILDGYPRYGEWSAGPGAPPGGRPGLLALSSHGTNAGKPGRGLTAMITLRP